MKELYRIALVGNPNCGKTTLFNALTGAHQRVGNWPGVTVERKSGDYPFRGLRFEVVDLPGTYSLDVTDQEVSLDEKIARDYVHGNEADLVINIVDAANLERNLYLTSQLAEMGVPLLVVLNMVDVAAARGMTLDAKVLAERLGCPVVPVVASEGEGIGTLKAAIADAVGERRGASVSVPYDVALEGAIAALVPQLQAAAARAGSSARWLAVRLLEGDDLARESAGGALSGRAAALAEGLDSDVDIRVADARYGLANRLAKEVVGVGGRVGRDLTERIDRVVLNRALGIPIFLLMMYLMFIVTINLGGAFIDFFEQLAGTLLVDGFGALLGALGAPGWLELLLAQGIGGGLQVVASFIPVIGFLFLSLSLLEDSGYMARAAFVMDRFMRWIGLPGKSFVPLLVGFGCTVPAVMATRTLEHRRDRLMTVAMAHFMSCGARLPVYVLLSAAFFAEGAQNVVFSLYLIGIAVAVLTGLVLKNTLLRGEATPFVMELPPYHVPTARGVLIHAWDRLKRFIFRAGRVIVPMVLVVNVLNALGTDGSYGNENSDRSVLAAVGRGVAPAFEPLGLNEENWPAVVGIFTGVLAKEAIVGTLNAAYASLVTGSRAADEKAPFDLGAGIVAAFATIPANLVTLVDGWLELLPGSATWRRDVVGTERQSLPDTEQAGASGVFGAMASRFDGGAGAFAYLLFILLYMPCTSAIAAIYQESGPRWTLFVACWTTGLAYGASTLFYQAATLGRHPLSSSLWIGALLAVFGLALYAMRRYARREAALPAEPQRT
ncbi:ferrous iron transport protein B [Azotobacter vinelandii CA]|uniref:Ferrous iron transport protein B n=2 Tax=Azotobacter vinelandii TaxID=354 RepID=C1DGF3_AZOVD|nr:Fe(2+) transporter permease subunit FeoB [Azotobacter vinelandii]ACO78464.1 ferrous iron transport protein B [Azotobacter vinelandii DJ]AGK13452.1 ferrous iron transport protein B [Azotobacter vinelandii CA]AGK17863.1 ferrous iron transport protein B [Azotobacter vinelandii CA6]SFY18179.1 ferrous iron transport protein B [Azotobacter vinelandii]